MHPIIIASMPRSGSSLVAKIFAFHGVQVGDCEEGNEHNKDGYYQNKIIEELHREVFKPRVHKGEPARYFDDFRIMILESIDMNIKFPWLVKFSAMYLPAWIESFPNAKVIVPRRNIQSIVKSGNKSGLFKVSEDSKTVQRHKEIMDEFSDVDVYFEDLLEGNYKDMEHALKYCGIDPDVNTIRKCIHKEYSKC